MLKSEQNCVHGNTLFFIATVC